MEKQSGNSGLELSRPDWFDEGLYPFESRWMNIYDHQIHYVDEGTGPPLLMVHGGIGWSFIFSRIIPLLKGKFRCIALDLPGFGLSIPRERDYCHDLPSYALLVAEFSRRLELSGALMLGVNIGGTVGIGAVQRNRKAFNGLILNSATLWPMRENSMLMQESNVMHMRVLPVLSQNAKFVKAAIKHVFMGKALSESELDMFVNPLLDKNKRDANRELLKSIKGSDQFLGKLKAGLEKISGQPLLYIAGRKDPLHSGGTVKKLGGLLPNLTEEIIVNGGQVVVLSQPEESAERIIAWYERQVEGGLQANPQ